MIGFINRVVLVDNCSAEMLSKICSCLRKNGIPYKTKSRGEKTNSTPMVRVSGGNVIGTMAGGVPLSWLEEPNRKSAYYIVYVKYRDYNRAKDLISIFY